jgi:hypothetical protein
MNVRRVLRQVAVGCGIVLALVVAFNAWLNAGIVLRHPRLVERLPGYERELLCLDPGTSCASVASVGHAPEIGTYRVRSPDGRRVAVTLSWEHRSPVLGRLGAALLTLPMGFVSDAPVTHTIAVWSAVDGKTRSILSIKEADPFSGSSHTYSWSTDAKALLIHGAGGLPEAPNEPMPLCLVYIPATNELVRLQSCPGLNEARGPASEACRRATGSSGASE